MSEDKPMVSTVSFTRVIYNCMLSTPVKHNIFFLTNAGNFRFDKK